MGRTVGVEGRPTAHGAEAVNRASFLKPVHRSVECARDRKEGARRRLSPSMHKYGNVFVPSSLDVARDDPEPAEGSGLSAERAPAATRARIRSWPYLRVEVLSHGRDNKRSRSSLGRLARSCENLASFSEALPMPWTAGVTPSRPGFGSRAAPALRPGQVWRIRQNFDAYRQQDVARAA